MKCTAFLVLAILSSIAMLAAYGKVFEGAEIQPGEKIIYGRDKAGNRVAALEFSKRIQERIEPTKIILAILRSGECEAFLYCKPKTEQQYRKTKAIEVASAIFNLYSTKVSVVTVIFDALEEYKSYRYVLRVEDLKPSEKQSADIVEIVKANYLPDYERPLLGVYSLIRTNYLEAVITKGKEHAVYGNVQQMAIREPFVVGLTGAYVGESPSKSRNKTGYFILDTKTNEAKTALSEDEWKAELKKIDWSQPTLKPPPMLIIDPF